MSRFFDIDGPFMAGLTKVADVFILNLLLIVCSLPLFTFGAAYTAMYYVTLKMVKDEDCYTFKSFFRSFKQNFRQATVIWIILFIIGMILYFDIKIMNGQYSQFIEISDTVKKVMMVLIMAAALIYMFTLVYVFPVLSRFDNSIKNTLRNALLMSIRHLPSTIAIILITLVPLIFIFMVPKALILIFVIFGLCAYCNSFFFVKIFKNYMPEETVTSDENFEVNLEKEPVKTDDSKTDALD